MIIVPKGRASILLFGGTGFIGRHLCCTLYSRGCAATVVSRTPDVSFLDSHAPGFNAVTLDEFHGAREKYLEDADLLVYLASTSVPATNMNQPWAELPENVMPAFELFSAAVEANPMIKLVYLSSGGTVYGAGHNVPISESANTAPISPYGYGKVVVEECIRYLGRTKGLRYAILRVANPVGVWQSNPRQGIVSVVFEAIRERRAITLYNGGGQVRDFLDADDVADAIIRSANVKNMDRRTWNIGSGVGYRIVDVVALIEKITGCTVDKKRVDGRRVDTDYSVLDCSSALMDLGWRSSISLEESIERVRFDRCSKISAE